MKTSVASDVFLSATAHDSGTAEIVKRAFEESGLTVFSAAELAPGARWEDSIREALGESKAIVVLLTRSALRSASILVELGGALAWKIRIYLLLDQVSPRDIPSFLASYQAAPLSDLSRIVDAVRYDLQPLTDFERDTLITVYRGLGYPMDQLRMRHDVLEHLTSQVNDKCGTDYPPERLLRELLRSRKQGILDATRRKPQSNSLG